MNSREITHFEQTVSTSPAKANYEALETDLKGFLTELSARKVPDLAILLPYHIVFVASKYDINPKTELVSRHATLEAAVKAHRQLQRSLTYFAMHTHIQYKGKSIKSQGDVS